MKRVATLAVAAVMSLVGGCADEASGCDEKPNLSEGEGQKRPVKIKPSQRFPGPAGSEVEAALPSPGPDADPTEQVLNHLRQESVRMAGVIGETGPGRCEGEVALDRGETTRCTVTFEGVTVPWLVTSKGMTSGSLGSFVSQDFIYTARPLKSVHTAQSIYDLYAWETGKNGTTEGPLAPVDPRCDRLPDVFTAEPGQDTGYYCQDVSESCTDGVQHFTWADWAVHADENGNVSFRAR
jgi:hypothetical protein